MSLPIDISALLGLHSQRIVEWKANGLTLQHEGFYRLAEENHAFNYQLWHAEDKARRDDMGHEFVYHAKREIDYCNQKRNDRMEAMDEWLFHHLKPENPGSCPINSESPGMIIDRLSILSLKAYHMDLQTKRMETDEIHRRTCANKLAIIHQQLDQLGSCLQQLLIDVQNKTRSFRIYHQFKMYNDPTLNPELY